MPLPRLLGVGSCASVASIHHRGDSPAASGSGKCEAPGACRAPTGFRDLPAGSRTSSTSRADQVHAAGIAVAVWLAGGERIRSRRHSNDFLALQQQFTLASWLALEVQGPPELRVPA